MLERRYSTLCLYINHLAYTCLSAVFPSSTMFLIPDRLASQQFVAHLFQDTRLPIKPIRFPLRPIPALLVYARTHAISAQTHPASRGCREFDRKEDFPGSRPKARTRGAVLVRRFLPPRE